MVRIAGKVLIAVVVVASVVLADLLFGYLNETGQIRENARKFRAEAAFLRTTTLNIVPSLDHAFPPSDRLPDSEIPFEAPRRFRSDKHGLIRSGRKVSGAETRILFLGGSTTEANEVDEPFRFVAVAESLLRKAGLDVTTMNAGVRGHTTQDSINALVNRRGFQDADVVVLLHNINDRLVLALQGAYHAELGTDAPTSWDAVGESFRGLLYSLWDYLSYRSNALFLARSYIGKFDPWTGEAAHDDGEGKGVAITEDTIDFGGETASGNQRRFELNLRLFVAIVRGLGKRPVLMTQPLGVKSPSQGLFNGSIRKVAQQLQVPLIDLDRTLPEDRGGTFLSDNIHLNNSGSKAVGQIVARELAPLLGGRAFAAPFDAGVVRVDDLLAQCREAASAGRGGLVKRLVGAPGRYPSFSSDGRWLLFQNWESGLDRIKAYDLRKGRLIELSPSGSQVNERHPAFLTVGENEFEVVFGLGFSEQKKSLEQLMVRRWPSMETRDLIPDPELGGAIPAVMGREVFFAGFRRQSEHGAPELFRFDFLSGDLTQLMKTPSEEWRPAIAPDGTIYFIANTEGNFDLYRLAPKHGRLCRFPRRCRSVRPTVNEISRGSCESLPTFLRWIGAPNTDSSRGIR